MTQLHFNEQSDEMHHFIILPHGYFLLRDLSGEGTALPTCLILEVTSA